MQDGFYSSGNVAESRMLISVPTELWNDYKRDILTTWFVGVPSLIGLSSVSGEGLKYAVFYAESHEDINTAVAKLPVGGIAFFLDELLA